MLLRLIAFLFVYKVLARSVYALYITVVVIVSIITVLGLRISIVIVLGLEVTIGISSRLITSSILIISAKAII